MQPIIAGPVFPEWYWTPIFLAISVGVPLLVAALACDGVLTFVLRRRGGGPRSTPAHASTVAAFWVGGAVVVYAVFAIGEHRERQAATDRAFAAIDVPLYEPAPLPPGYIAQVVRPFATSAGGELYGAYRGPSGALTVTQRASEPGAAEEIAGRCFVGLNPGEPTEYNPPSCRPRPTPGGRNVSDDGRELVLRLGDATRVDIDYDPTIPRAELERFVDALRTTPEQELQLVGDG
jgi:hypothetical protein